MTALNVLTALLSVPLAQLRISFQKPVARELPAGALVRAPKPSGRAVFTIDPGADLAEVLRKIEERPEVEYAEPDVINRAQLIPNDTRFSEQWSLPKISAPAGWDKTTGATSGILIGIIDSGISMSPQGQLDHPDLNSSRYIMGTDFVDGGTPRDLNSHGTHVTGIAAAESNNSQGVTGINWNTPVYICRTQDAFGYGSAADFADAVRGPAGVSSTKSVAHAPQEINKFFCAATKWAVE